MYFALNLLQQIWLIGEQSLNSAEFQTSVFRDVTSKSDPMAVVFIYDVATKKWFEAGRTEAMRDNLNPDWQDDVIVDYFFEEAQKFRVEVYDKERS